jgi:hypothetical protein
VSGFSLNQPGIEMGVLTFDLAFFLLATSAAAWRAVGLFGKNMQERVCIICMNSYQRKNSEP